jgi:hypothetical protein
VHFQKGKHLQPSKISDNQKEEVNRDA